ncbi:MAG: hypothetical protein LBC67_04945 [Spirochaetales bacterium]|jgi:hypothetical protein|nr:hypothetical protein [Spirochaetales bacterium]
MITIQKTVDIPADRRLTVDIPLEVPTGKTSVVLSFPQVKTSEAGTAPRGEPWIHEAIALYPLDRREALNAIARNYGQKGDSSRVYAGCLKGKGIFKGDSVAIQRKMRDEWQDSRS